MSRLKRFRILLPLGLVVAWFAVAGIGGPVFGKLSEVTKNDQASFLPASAESTRAQEQQAKFYAGSSIPAIIVVQSPTAITPAQLGQYAVLAQELAKVDGIQQSNGKGLVIGPIPSDDKLAVQYIVPIDATNELKAVVPELRSTVNEFKPDGTTAYVTGPAGLSADLVKAFGGIDGILLLVAVGAVFIILLFVYRSLLLPFLVLFTSIFALCAAILVVYLLAKQGIIKLNGQSQGILSILVIGAATDYSLLLVSRYREAFAATDSKWAAMRLAIKGSFEPILASAATVILSLLCLLFSDLNSNRSLGPIAATGIFFAFVASLTLLPALLMLFGKAAFWPTKLPKPAPDHAAPVITTGLEELTGVWKKVGGVISRYPRQVWMLTAVILLIGAANLPQLRANGVAQTDLILAQSDAVDGQAVLAKHFSAGSGTPLVVIAPESDLAAVTEVLTSNGLTDVAPYTGAAQGGPASARALPPKVVGGNVLINATLQDNVYSEAAQATVVQVRQDLHEINDQIVVGGTTAVALDTNETAQADIKKIIPLILAVILIILIILLRSLIAPVLLILTVVLSFAATLGVSAVVFNHIFHFPGADATVPLFGFVFLVALGVDYNIFLMTRAREEALKLGTRPAILHSLGKTGGVITSAGVVLAATFAALGIIPILFLAQIAFIVAFGVLLDALIVRSLLVPALVYDFGRIVWWPSCKITK